MLVVVDKKRIKYICSKKNTMSKSITSQCDVMAKGHVTSICTTLITVSTLKLPILTYNILIYNFKILIKGGLS